MDKDYSKISKEVVDELGWEIRLTRNNRYGHIDPTVENTRLILDNDPKYAGKLKYNEYLRQREYDGKEWDDFMECEAKNFFREKFHTNNVGFVTDVVSDEFNKNRYNPVVEYIRGLKWDGKKRIERLFIDLLEADDTPIVKEMTRKWMIAALKRTLQPGCKFDNMIMLVGGQGIGKTTMCERLSRGFFSSVSLEEIGNKDLVDKLNKTWIAIIDEMDGWSTRELGTIKTFLSICEDKVRLAYARNASTFKRHCIFIGSTNDDNLLRDPTGNRRFWMIKCNKTDKDSKVADTMTPEFVNQLWAEALQYLMDNPNQYLDIDSESMEDFNRNQENFQADDSYIEALIYELEKEYSIEESGEVKSIDELTWETSGPKHKINKIPMFILKKYMKDKYKEDRSNKWIAGQMKTNEWECKTARFKGVDKPVKALVRKKPIVTKKKYDPLEEFSQLLSV